MSEWELVFCLDVGDEQRPIEKTHRMRVDGGWLYKVVRLAWEDESDAVAICFVPIARSSQKPEQETE